MVNIELFELFIKNHISFQLRWEIMVIQFYELQLGVFCGICGIK